MLARTSDFSNEEISKVLWRAIDSLDYTFSPNIKNVVIKPNLMYYWDYTTGETTDPKIVSAIIDYVREKLGNAIQIFIAEADASAMRTKYAFKVLGYEKLSKEVRAALSKAGL